MNHYLLSWIDPPTANSGHSEVTLPTPIRGMDDVEALATLLQERYSLTNPIVMGFSRFDNEEA